MKCINAIRLQWQIAFLVSPCIKQIFNFADCNLAIVGHSRFYIFYMSNGRTMDTSCHMLQLNIFNAIMLMYGVQWRCGLFYVFDTIKLFCVICIHRLIQKFIKILETQFYTSLQLFSHMSSKSFQSIHTIITNNYQGEYLHNYIN